VTHCGDTSTPYARTTLGGCRTRFFHDLTVASAGADCPASCPATTLILHHGSLRAMVQGSYWD
jgi:hypothetical protein